jgi:hypothetical protein
MSLTPVDAPSIKSRPVYAPLVPRPGKLHVIVADGEGAEAVAEMLGKANDRSAILSAAHVMYVPGPNGTDQKHCARRSSSERRRFRRCCPGCSGWWRRHTWGRSSISRGQKG